MSKELATTLLGILPNPVTGGMYALNGIGFIFGTLEIAEGVSTVEYTRTLSRVHTYTHCGWWLEAERGLARLRRGWVM